MKMVQVMIDLVFWEKQVDGVTDTPWSIAGMSFRLRYTAL